MAEDELAASAVADLERLPALRVDQLGVDEPARAEVHSLLLLAFAPEGGADVADPPRFGHARAPPLPELRPKRRLAPARLARDKDAAHTRSAQVLSALSGPLEHVRGIGGRED